MYLVTYEYKSRDYIGYDSPIYQEVVKTTTKTFSYDELRKIEHNVKTSNNYIKILSCYKLD